MAFDSSNDEPHVLIVEDDTGLADLYGAWLEGFCTVRIANDCETAYGLFEDSFDVALLDRHLPDGSGDDLLREIRDLGLDWPVAMVTAADPDMDIVRMEFDEYICKPVSRDAFQNTVSQLIARTKFEDYITRYDRLSTKKEILEEHYTRAELSASDEYADLVQRLERCRKQLLDEADSLSGAEVHIDESTSSVSCD